MIHNVKKKRNRKIAAIGSYVMGMMLQAAYASATVTPPATTPASGLETSKLVTGTQALIADATKVLLILSASITAGLVIFDLIKLQAAEDQDVTPMKKKIKITLIIGILVFVVSGLLSTIMSYYVEGGVTI